jgi:threonine dehydrogenase-like Zn-dependent dehydrogenase
MCTRVAQQRGIERVMAVDLVPARLERAMGRGTKTFDLSVVDDLKGEVLALTHGRGPDSVIDAVGMEAHGSPLAKAAHHMTSVLPTSLASKLMERAGFDRLASLRTAIDLVRRGGTISISGVYGGAADPLPMLRLFDKQVQLRMGQANVRCWVDDILPLLMEADPLGVDNFATHHMPLAQAPAAYKMFQEKADGAVKVILKPALAR